MSITTYTELKAAVENWLDHTLFSARVPEFIALRFMRPRDVLVLQTEMWAVAFLNGRRMVSIPLARTGDSERRQMLSEYTLVARNEKASGGVFDLTTS